MTTATLRPNKFGGRCSGCSAYVPAQKGILAGSPGHWSVEHRAGECKPQEAPKPITATPGVYLLDGTIYVVKPSKRTKGRVYACKLVESAPRITENGTEIPFDLEFTPGIVGILTEAHRMSLADANAISARYARCLCCNRALYAAATIKRCIATGQWVGRDCRKTYFP